MFLRRIRKSALSGVLSLGLAASAVVGAGMISHDEVSAATGCRGVYVTAQHYYALAQLSYVNGDTEQGNEYMRTGNALMGAYLECEY
jgi:hypothetical protein